MAKEGYARWLKDNSIPTPVEISLVDGGRLKGILHIPRDRFLREMLNGGDPFIEFDCAEFGPTVVAKQSILSARPFQLPPANQLQRRLQLVEGIDAFKALGIRDDISREQLLAIYRRKASLYHPDHYPREHFPEEICDFVTSMTRRLYLAFAEVDALFAARDAAREEGSEEHGEETGQMVA